MCPMSRPKVVERRPEVLVRSVEGDLVILDRGRGVVHHLNSTAALVWSRCDGERALADIAMDIAQMFDVDPETAQRDVTAVVRQLAASDLLTDAAPPPEADEQARREED